MEAWNAGCSDVTRISLRKEPHAGSRGERETAFEVLQLDLLLNLTVPRPPGSLLWLISFRWTVNSCWAYDIFPTQLSSVSFPVYESILGVCQSWEDEDTIPEVPLGPHSTAEGPAQQVSQTEWGNVNMGASEVAWPEPVRQQSE